MWYWISSALFLLLLATDGMASGVRLRLHVEEANEPYSASVHAIHGLFMVRRDGTHGQTLEFGAIPPGLYMLDVRFPSGHEYTRTILVPEEAPGRKGFDLSISRSKAFFARDLGHAAHRISIGQLANEEDLQRAVRAFERALRDDDAERAEEILAEALNDSPGAALGWNNLGALRLQQNRVAEAIPLLQQAHLLDAGQFEANVNLARAYAAVEILPAALHHAELALQARPLHASALSMMVGILFQAHREPEAEPYLEILREVDPDNVCCPELLLAAILQERGELRAAAQLVLRFTEKHPQHSEAAALRDRALRVLQAQPQAISELRP
jgi:tetratricopeptide (TPR) repeat protein